MPGVLTAPSIRVRPRGLAHLLVVRTLLAPLTLAAQSAGTVTVPPDSAHWIFEGGAGVSEYLGRRCVMLDGGAATVKDLELRDGVIDLDVATPAARGFFGLQFRSDSVNGEFVYLRQHKSGLPDALQYTPVFNTGLNWQLYSGPGFTGRANIPRESWFHLRLAIAGAGARLYLEDTTRPALDIPDLKSGLQRGGVALADLVGATCFTNVEIHPTPDAPWQRHLPPMPPGTLTRWSLSPAYDALQRDPERPLSPAERGAMRWQSVEAEPPGLVAIYRYRPAPHPRVTFQTDWSTRLVPQPGTKLVYARTTISARRDEVRKLELGYSDEVSVFLNGRILFRGRSAQSFRDPGFLGIVAPENDAIYLPLRQGSNELVLALSELGGGWGFVARLAEGGLAR
ncbi:MAG TPA: hypothetical protein VHR43_17760 [Gemmatimonadales bacterium]|nr:hypothetical protein [Gemmatimonadales bacterium]